MNDRDIRREERASRVVTFGTNNGTANGGDLPPDHKTVPHFTTIAGLLAQLELAKTGQLTGKTSKSTLRDALWLDFKDIIRTAKAIKKLDATFDASLYVLPEDKTDSLVKTYADKLLLLLEDNPKPVAEGGDTPAQLATKAALRARFISYDLPDDFVADLRADRNAMDDADEDKATDGQDSVKATALITKLLDQMDGEIFQIDTTLRNRYAHLPELLAA
jgi:hypothetical protein